MKSALILVVLLGSLTLSVASAQPSVEGCAKAQSSKVIINVRERGAKGDGRADDTAAIQKAIDEVAGTGGMALLPDGIYMVNAVAPRQLTLKSRMTLKLSQGATLKAISNGASHYAILTITGGSNVSVIGGNLEGDREHHQGTSGEWGMGLRIMGGAEHITIIDVTARKMWGDGFYIDGAKDVRICGVTADYNRRQGLSIIDAIDVFITGSVFKNTRGTRPSAGIDLEPDRADQTIRNVSITRSKFLDNAGAGIQILGKKGTANVSDVRIKSNLFRGSPPVKVKYADGVLDSAICHNRYATRPEPSRDPAMVATDVQEMTILAGCGDPGLRIRY
ncbi:MAG: right-handed parallel beta-helix repeat-containing protein [Hyphomicrobium sp.]|uniref:glycosyl hydrolase family 28-related protein n=1 Tax=Hyphomicrobium sp. TaxID=82 RepID=UPI0013220828|nr:glycosyl hydrolase family 28-related protein [Hyphomicrobium sp.]KAB2937038.1 MAG: hypothetical protein F9K20_20650 [Hyphomicrobium sp.]MBZ0210831.1 right-handed parallel beta-helix repeat-containing protein [Hyphomicrobium sp.]